MECFLCPRKCGALRTENDNVGGICGMPSLPVVARAALHFWEEPCISGKNGSGTVFFSGCSLKCVFCQNNEISHGRFGKTVSVERLAEIFRELENMGAHNINLVNPTHYIPAIKSALKIYKPEIPIVYNSGGYDTEEQIEEASKFCDIFLMDLKYVTPERALKYSNAADYPEVAEKAILKCAEIVGKNEFFPDGTLKKGLIVRHLIMPLATNEAIKVVDFVEENAPFAILSIMGQYTPCGDLEKYPEINRKITLREYKKVLDRAYDSNIETVYKQKLSSGSDEFIPPFDLTGV